MAAEYMQFPAGKAPALGFWDRKFNILHQAADATWYKININSLKKRFHVFGKVTVMKNILLGSSPMNNIELENKVKSLRGELK